MDKPIPDGCVIVDTIHPALNTPARRKFYFRELKHWRKITWGLEFTYNEDGDGGTSTVVIPWTNIREVIYNHNSKEYIKAWGQYRTEYDFKVSPRSAPTADPGQWGTR